MSSSAPERAHRAVRTPRHAPDTFGMAFEHPQAAARLHLPQPHSSVIGPGECAPAIRTPRHASNPVGVALEHRAGNGPTPPPTAARCGPRPRRGRIGRQDSTPRSRQVRCGLRASAGSGPTPPPTTARCNHRPQRGRTGQSGLRATLLTQAVWPSSTCKQRFRVHLPQPHGVVRGPGEDAPAVRTPRHAPDKSGVAFEHAQAAARLHLPQPHGMVIGPGEDAPASPDSTPRY